MNTHTIFFCYNTFEKHFGSLLNQDSLMTGKIIFDTLNIVPSKRHFKTKQLYLGSDCINMSEFYFIELLHTMTRCYVCPFDNNGKDYRNNYFQFIIGEDFNFIKKKEPFLKKFFDGGEMRLNVRGSHVGKMDNPLIILTSHQSLEKQLSNKTRLPLFEARLKPIQLTEDALLKNFFTRKTLIKDCIKTL